MNPLHLNLSAEECAFLTEFLESALKDARIEGHRTRSPNYRKGVEEREAIISGLLAKLGEAAACEHEVS
jgi:hypothetical protein